MLRTAHNKESAMNTNTKASGISEIRELTADELDAVNGGAFNAYQVQKPDGSGSPAGQKPDGSVVQACQWGVGRGLS